jgi:hypothetical protein
MAIKLIVLEGSYKEMGMQYGVEFKEELHGALEALKDFFILQHQMTYEQILQQAESFHARYSYSFVKFLEGMGESSGLNFSDIKILNGMETIKLIASEENIPQASLQEEPLVNANSSNEQFIIQTDQELGGCSFIFLPPHKTYSGDSLIGRYYDFIDPFRTIAQNITVSILKDNNHVPTAIIGMPGQIYCPTCINSEGLFLELNNGMPSGGFHKEQTRQSLLINMLHMKQNSDDLATLVTQLMAAQSDYSLIINIADKKEVKSFEFSSTMGMKTYFPAVAETFVSTNYYQNSTWYNIPEPTDESTWLGVSRHDNLIRQSNAKNLFTVADLQEIMNTDMNNGGALWDYTIYQIIYDSSNQDLYITRPIYDHGDWTKIPLVEYF